MLIRDSISISLFLLLNLDQLIKKEPGTGSKNPVPGLTKAYYDTIVLDNLYNNPVPVIIYRLPGPSNQRRNFPVQ
jgi:hypothetical protein